MVSQIVLSEAQVFWKSFLNTPRYQSPFFDPRWHSLWHKHLAGNLKPFTLKVDGIAIAPFARTENTIYFSGGSESTDYMDIICPNDSMIYAWDQILLFLKNQGIRNLKLSNIPSDSPTISYLRTYPNTQIDLEDTTPTVELARDWDTYLDGLVRKNRHELERKLRKFEREHPNANIVSSSNSSDDVSTFISLMRQNLDKDIFLNRSMTNFFTDMIFDFAKDIRLIFIEIEGQKIAGILGFQTVSTFFLYNSGQLNQYPGAGFYLKAMSIKMAIEEELQSYNFLQGSERYKYEMGGKDFDVLSATITL